MSPMPAGVGPPVCCCTHLQLPGVHRFDRRVCCAVVEFQRDDDVVDEAHEAESLRSTSGAVDSHNGGHGAGASAMEIDGHCGHVSATPGGAGGSRQGGSAVAGRERDVARQTSSRIHHVHFHESGCPPFAARTPSQTPPQGSATAAPSGSSPTRRDVGHLGAPGIRASQHVAPFREQGEDAPEPAPRRVPSAEQLALLQRVDSHQTIRPGARAASAGALPEELSAVEQGSVVGVKRSNSGIVSPSKEGEKLPLKCAIRTSPVGARCCLG